MDKKSVFLPPGERLPEGSEEVASGIAEEPPYSPERIDIEEELEWIKHIRKNILKACQMPKV
ncbi:MAG: hypothetical protein PHW73_12345 [Atribacterota bacterium]|nr:hypothetical protein [Atribacterota bacterium]